MREFHVLKKVVCFIVVKSSFLYVEANIVFYCCKIIISAGESRSFIGIEGLWGGLWGGWWSLGEAWEALGRLWGGLGVCGKAYEFKNSSKKLAIVCFFVGGFPQIFQKA